MDNHFLTSRSGRKQFVSLLVIAAIPIIGVAIIFAVSYTSQLQPLRLSILVISPLIILSTVLTLSIIWRYLTKQNSRQELPLINQLEDFTSLVKTSPPALIEPKASIDLFEDLDDKSPQPPPPADTTAKGESSTIDKNERLLQDEQRRIKELNLINQINQTLLASVDFEVTIDAVLRNVRECFNYTAAEINIWNESLQRLDAFAVGDTGYTTQTNNYYRINEGYTGWIATHHRPLIIPVVDQADVTIRAKRPDLFPFNAYIGLPLSVGEEFLGTLELAHLEPNSYTSEDVESLLIIVNQASIALKHAKLFQENERHAKTQAELAEIAALASVTLNLDELLQRIMSKTVAALGATKGAVLLLNQDETILQAHPAGMIGFPPEQREPFSILTNEPQFDDTPLISGRSFRSNNAQTDKRVLPFYKPLIERFDITSVLIVPLTTVDKNVGEIYVTNKPTPFTHYDLVFLSSVAAHFASAILNASLFQTTERNLQELSILYDASAELSSTLSADELLANLAERLINLLPAEECAISHYDEESSTLHPLYERHTPSSAAKLTAIYAATDLPVITQVLQTQKSALIQVDANSVNDIEQTLLSEWRVANSLLLPLVIRNRTIGLVELYAEQPVRYQTDEISLAQTLINQAAVALQNAQRYAKTDSQLNLRLKELSGLQMITRQLNSTLDQDTIVQYVIAEAVRATGADFGYVYFYDPEIDKLTRYIDDSASQETIDLGDDTPHQPTELVTIVLQSKRPEIVDNLAKDTDSSRSSPHIASEMAVPILNANAVEGIISLASRQVGQFTKQQLHYVEALADQAMIAIRNAKEFASLRQERRYASTRVDQLARLSEINRAFRANSPLRSILEDIAFAIQETVGFNSVLLSLTKREQLQAITGAGIPITQLEKLTQTPGPVGAIETLFQEKFLLSHSYFIPQGDLPRQENLPDISYIFPIEETIKPVSDVQAWHPGDLLLTPLRNAEGQLLGLLSVTAPRDGKRPTESLVTVLEIFANQATTAIENTNLFQEVQHRLVQLKLFSQINSHISAILNPVEILDEVVILIANAFDYYYIQVYQFDQFDATSLISRNGAGKAQVGPRPLNLGNRISMNDNSIVTWTAKHRHLLRVNDVRQEPRYRPNDLLPKTRAEIALPLRSGDTIFGVLDIQHDEPDVFDREDTFNLQALADQMAVATQNALLFETEQHRIAQLDILNQTGQAINATTDLDDLMNVIYEQVAKLMSADNMFIALYDGETNTIDFALTRGGPKECWQSRIAGNGLTEYILTHKEPLLLTGDVTKQLAALGIEQIGQSAKSWLGVPMLFGDEVLGVIGLQSYEREDAYSDNDSNVLSTIAAQAAISLQNSHLILNSQLQAEEMHRLYELGISISQEFDLVPLLRTVVQEALTFTGRQLGTIWLWEEETENYLVEHVVNQAVADDYPAGELESWLPSKPSILARQVIEQGLLLVIDDVVNDPRTTPQAKQAGIQACVGIPIMIEAQTIGALFVHSLTLYKFKDNDLNLLQFLGTQAAVAIRNVQLVQRLNKFRSELERRVEARTEELSVERDRVDTLYHIARQLSSSLDLDRVLSEALTLLDRTINITQGAILLTTPTTDHLIYRAALGRSKPLPREGIETRYETGVGLAGHILETRQPYISANLTEDPIWLPDQKELKHHSVMAVPLITAYDVLGVLMLFHTEENYFTENHLSLVSAAAPMIATAIRNADLYTLINDQAERVGSLLRKVQAEDSKNKAIIEGIADGVLVIDAEYTIQLINSVAAKMLGTSQESLANEEIKAILADHQKAASEQAAEQNTTEQKIAEALYQIIIAQRPTLHQQTEPLLSRIDIDGTAIVVLLTAISIAANSNVPSSTLVVIRDVTREADLDRIKDEFISTVSHELRTPMTPIKGYTQLLIQEDKIGPLNEMQRKFLGVIKSNADRLDALVNDILDISRIDADRVKLVLQSVSLTALIDQVLPIFDYQISEKNLTVALDIPTELPLAYADPDRLIQVLVNLIGNCVKYTRPNDKIDIRAVSSGDHLQVDVIDTGLGISAEDQKYIFDRFFRAERDASSLVDGTGLGLSIAKTFIDLMNGEIWVQSELGQGSTFSFTLPIVKQVLVDSKPD